MWRNMYSPQPVLAGTMLFGNAFGWTTERLSPALLSALEGKLPGVVSRAVSLDAAEIVARLAQHIQLQGDMAAPFCGVGSRDEKKQCADIFFACRDPMIAPQCLALAGQIVYRLAHSDITVEHLAGMLKSCDDMIARHGLEWRTWLMVQAAERLGIPWFRNSGFVRHVQLGHGHRQRRLWKTSFSDEPAYGRDYAKDKLLTMSTLAQLMLPVGQYAPVRDVASAMKFAAEIGYPVVLKPVVGGKGDSVYANLRDEAELKRVLTAARINERPFMLQSFFPGDDHRLMIVNGKLAFAVQRTPASVKGDGQHTIAELIEIENRDPVRVNDLVMYPIVLDADSDRIISQQGFTRSSVIAKGRVVRVKGTANIATGGTMLDVTNMVHPDNVHAAIRAAKAIGLVITGVDFITPDITKSWHEVGGGICAGYIVGSATTEGVRIDGELIEQGDFASADGASIVLRDSIVTAAVLETARGGIVKTGLYVDRCEVAALLNIERDYIGMDGVETLDDMVKITRKSLDVARKAVVLNADDSRCLALADEFKPRLRTILFSKSPETAAIRGHVASGGEALFLAKRDGRETIVVASASDEIPLLATDEIPATNGGLIWFHGVNALSAAALAIALDIGHDAIRAGLSRYGKEYAGAMLRTVFAADSMPTVEHYRAAFRERSETGQNELSHAQA